MGVDRLRRAVGTFRNVIVVRWAGKLLKMWWPETGSIPLLSNGISNLQILNVAEIAKSARMPNVLANLLQNFARRLVDAARDACRFYVA